MENNIKLTLVKTVNYDLNPFGKFLIKDIAFDKRATNANPKTLLFNVITFDERAGMPYDEDQYNMIVKYMKKNKTDILVSRDTYNTNTYYTLMGKNLVEITHPKLRIYQNFIESHFLKDAPIDEAWQKFDAWYKASKYVIF